MQFKAALHALLATLAIAAAAPATDWAAGCTGVLCRDLEAGSFLIPAGEDGILRITESCSRTNDSFGRAGVWLLPELVRADSAGEAGALCAERCQAALTDVGEGSWASFSARLGCWGAVGTGGSDAAIMSYADGVRSTSEASSCRMISIIVYSGNRCYGWTHLERLLALLTDESTHPATLIR